MRRTCAPTSNLSPGWAGRSASSRSSRSVRLLQPERHAHLAAHRGCGARVRFRPLARAGALMELAEPEVAVRDEPDMIAFLEWRQELGAAALAEAASRGVGLTALGRPFSSLPRIHCRSGRPRDSVPQRGTYT